MRRKLITILLCCALVLAAFTPVYAGESDKESTPEPVNTSTEESVAPEGEGTAAVDAPDTEKAVTVKTVYAKGGSSKSSAVSISVGLGSGQSVIDQCKVVTTADTTQEFYWYKFSTSSHDSFYTTYFKNNSIDAWVYYYLYDSDENLLWSGEDHENQSDIEKLKLNPYSVYYIKVKNSNKKSGNFQFYVTEHYDDVKDTISNAQRLNLGTRYVRGLQSWYDQDNFYFHTTSNNSFYALTFKNLNMDAWVKATLYTVDSEKLVTLEKHKNQTGTEYVKLRPNTDYRVIVNESSGRDTGKIGTYSLTITELVDDCPSTAGSAKLITRNITRSGRINSDDGTSYPATYTGQDEDWYKFKTGSLTKNYFYVKNLNADGWLKAQVQDQYGEIIWEDECYNGNEMRGNAVLKSNSVYYLRIYGPKGNYKYRVSCPIRVTKVTLNHTYVNLKVGHNYLLIATVYPSNASNKIVGWTSTNKSVAKVNTSGRVYGLKKGTATVYAITRDGGKRAACTIYVK